MRKWTGYCLKNWLSENHGQPYAPEYKVKRLLDRCGTLLLRDVPKGGQDTLTSYKEMIVGNREISVSACPGGYAEMLENGALVIGNASADDRLQYALLTEKLDSRGRSDQETDASKGQEKKITRFDRLEAIRRDHPGCEMQGCRVDVDGVFFFREARYQINAECARYASKKTRYGDQYDMDYVIAAALPNGVVLFADQDGCTIDYAMITRYEAVME